MVWHCKCLDMWSEMYDQIWIPYKCDTATQLGHFSGESLNKNVSVLVDILLKCVLRGPIENESVIVQELAWHRTITSH